MSQQTINVGTVANDGTGDTLRSAFQKTNVNFTELYGGSINPNEIRVTSTADNAFGDAIAAAKLLSSSNKTVTLQPGVINQTQDVTIDFSVTVNGPGMDSSLVKWASDKKLILDFSGIELKTFQLARDGSNAGVVLTTNVTGLADWLSDIRLTGMKVINSSGGAAGMITSINNGCHFEGTLFAVETHYGARSEASLFINPAGETGTDTGDVPAAWVVKYTQSVGSNPGTWGAETFPGRKFTSFKGCKLEGLGLNTCVFEGLIECSVAGPQPSWMDTAPGAYNTYFEGCEIYGPLSAHDNGAFSTYGTNAATTKGAFRAQGCAIYGANTFMKLRVSYITGCDIVNSSHQQTYLADNMRESVIQGCSVVCGPVNTVRDLAGSAVGFYNCTFETDLVAQFKGFQPFFRGCRRLDDQGKFYGYEGGNLAIYIQDSDPAQFMDTGPTSDYSVATFTAECWTKINGIANTGAGICSHNNAGNTGWAIFAAPSTGQVYALVGVGYASALLATGLSAKANATITSDATEAADGDIITIGSISYRIKTTMAQAYDVKRNGTAATTLANLKKAINATGTPGTEYFAGTLVHPTATATTITSTTLFVETKLSTTKGRDVPISVTTGHLSWASPWAQPNLSGNFFDADWHHVAVTQSGTTAKLWIEGSLVSNSGGNTGTITSSTPSGKNRLTIGAGATNVLPNTQADAPGVGMIKQFHFSKVVRYTTTFVPRKVFLPDADSYTLYGNTTKAALIWEDKCGNHDATTAGGVIGGSGVPTIWVDETYTPAA